MTPQEADFHHVGLEKYIWIFNLIFGVYDATRGCFPPCWTGILFGFSIRFLECLTPRQAVFHHVGLEKYSDFQFDFLESMTPQEADFHRVGLEKINRIFNLIFGVFDSTRG